MGRLELPDLVVPADMQPEEMPDLLRYWYLGSKGRRHMMMRRFLEVDKELKRDNAGVVLDIGSAWGYNVMALTSLGLRAVALDLVTDQFAYGQRIARANTILFDALGADAAGLPFRQACFGSITMVETFEHVFEEDRPAVFRECFRVLRPGGRLVLSTPNQASIVERAKRFVVKHPGLRGKLPTMMYPSSGVRRAGYHPYRYHLPISKKEITGLLHDAGFDVRRARYFLFVLKNTPDGLFALARSAEKLLEHLPGIRRLAATFCIVADKPE